VSARIFSSLEGLQLGKVERKSEWGWDGDAYEVLCAFEADGKNSPAWNLLEQLRKGEWPEPDTTELPPDAQISIRAKVRSLIKMLAQEGRLPPGNFNKLRDGIWELKHVDVRLTFYDTLGDGNFTPKEGEPTYDWQQNVYYPQLPDFDDYLRLGHAFEKPLHIRKTTEHDIAESLRIRTEDLTHDSIEIEDIPKAE
jgi:hypothetical protein